VGCVADEQSGIFVRMSQLSERLLQARGKMTREKLNELTQISTKSIENYEKGTRIPRVNDLKKIAAATGTTSAYLLGEIDDPSPDALRRPAPAKEVTVKTRMAPDTEPYADDDLLLLQEKLDTIIAIEREKKRRLEQQMRESDERKAGGK
jgi:transcriptional regulator with XRE-family HTH domain